MAKGRRERRTILVELACRACGGREFLRQGTLFTCRFCGAESQARRITDALCGEGGGTCHAKAHRLCACCGLPLCERHDDPKTCYWRTPLEPQALCPAWDPGDLADWAALRSPLQRFPLPGFEPFAWELCGREAAAELGAVESRLFHALKPIAVAGMGDLGEEACVFDGVCSACFLRTSGEIESEVARVKAEFRRAAVERRLDAMERELLQDLAYVEAWQAERGARTAPGGGGPQGSEPTARDFLPELNLRSPLGAWRATEGALRARLRAVRRLRERL